MAVKADRMIHQSEKRAGRVGEVFSPSTRESQKEALRKEVREHATSQVALNRPKTEAEKPMEKKAIVAKKGNGNRSLIVLQIKYQNHLSGHQSKKKLSKLASY